MLPGVVVNLRSHSGTYLSVLGEDPNTSAGGELNRDIVQQCRDGARSEKHATVDDKVRLRPLCSSRLPRMSATKLR